jgi:MoaA/NifB/PqqE/SkfB family radical SAM enzyme
MGRVYAERAGVLDATAPIVPRGRVVVVHAQINRKEPVVKSLDFEFTDELVKEIADAVREADEIANSDFQPPSPGPACQYCDYRDRCRSDLAATVVSTTALAELPA